MLAVQVTANNKLVKIVNDIIAKLTLVHDIRLATYVSYNISNAFAMHS
jgi:hypothetical protein